MVLPVAGFCLLLNAKLVFKKTSFVHSVIVGERTDLVCIIKTWLSMEERIVNCALVALGVTLTESRE